MISFVYNRVFEQAPIFPYEEEEKKDRQEEVYHAYAVLTAEFPLCPKSMITQAIDTKWDYAESDEQNLITLKYLGEYQ